MSFEEVMSSVMMLGANVEALAAVGAFAGARASGAALDPDVEAALKNVLAAAGVEAVDTLEPQQLMMLAGATRSLFLQANDVLCDAGRERGWRYTDPLVLEGQGRASALIPGIIARTHPGLANVSSFLDVGVGVARLAIAATNVWPACNVVGIDTWDPSLEIARANVAEAGLEARITLRKQNVVDLDDHDAFDCVWLPTFFFPDEMMKAVLSAVVQATKPGGIVVLGTYAPPPNPVARATIALRTVRDGGTVLDVDDASALLRDAGCADVGPAERDWPVPLNFVLGRKP